jgi:N-acetylmuramoyl-L-alanine amidase
MHRSKALTRRRTAVVALVVPALLVSLPLPSAAGATPPPAVTGLAGSVVNRAAVLTWATAGTGPSLACEISAPAATVARSACIRSISVSGRQARDTGFTNTAGKTYAVWAADADGTLSDQPAQVTVAKVPAAPTATVLYRSAGWVTIGRSAVLTATLRRAGVRIGPEPVELWSATPPTAGLRLVRRTTVGATGVVRMTVAPTRSTRYAVRFAGNAFSRPSVSQRSIAVVPIVSAALTRTAIAAGTGTVAFGRVTPTLAQLPVRVQRWTGTGWATVARGATTTGGYYRVPLSAALGSHRFRVVTVAEPNLAVGRSGVLGLSVYRRNLSSGMVGADVLSLQRFLAAHHYTPGALNGRYGYDTVHAVMTFQKVHGLRAHGRWTRTEQTRSQRPTAWRLRYPSAGRAAEIDVSKQVLVLSVAGKVVRIIDVSTGNEELYTVDGRTSRAHTPRGRFSVYRKISGVRISRLGALYRPSYFLRGWAIHGSNSVPSYPASHGCVRITNSNTDRVYGFLRVGTPVAVYDS